MGEFVRVTGTTDVKPGHGSSQKSTARPSRSSMSTGRSTPSITPVSIGVARSAKGMLEGVGRDLSLAWLAIRRHHGKPAWRIPRLKWSGMKVE